MLAGSQISWGVPLPVQFLVVALASWLCRREQHVIEYLQAENRVLREQLGKRRIRFTNGQRRRLAVRAKKLGRKTLSRLETIVTPDTLLRWYRTLVARKYDGSTQRRVGRPPTREVIEALVVRMASENSLWGYTRIRGALQNVGYTVSRSTIRRILRDHGLDPSPKRGDRTPWKSFLAAHWGAIAAADFFTVEVLTLAGLVRVHVLFVIDLKTRFVEIAGIVRQPYEAWMCQVARNLTDVVDGFLKDHRYLILDRDPLYTGKFRDLLCRSGVKVARLPARSPNLNAHAERFVRSIKYECLAKVIPLGEAHLRKIIREYVEHYHTERNHQGLDNRLLRGPPPVADPTVPIQRKQRVGGILSYYHREAA